MHPHQPRHLKRTSVIIIIIIILIIIIIIIRMFEPRSSSRARATGVLGPGLSAVGEGPEPGPRVYTILVGQEEEGG